MSRLTVICVDVLSRHLLADNRCPALNNMNVRDIKASIPCLPLVASTTIWTGLDVSQHGVGLDGRKKASATMLWDRLAEAGIKTYIEGELDGKAASVPSEEADLSIISLDGFGESCHRSGMSSRSMARRFRKLDTLIGETKGDIIVLGACGLSIYASRFNLAVFLQGHGYCRFSDDGEVMMEESSAYPSVVAGDDGLQFGVFINRHPGGWVTGARADSIQGTLTGWLNKVPNLCAFPKVRMYSDGDFFAELPDIILYANTDRIFPCLGRDRATAIEGDRQINYSVNTVLFSNFDVGQLASTKEVASVVTAYFLGS